MTAPRTTRPRIIGDRSRQPRSTGGSCQPSGPAPRIVTAGRDRDSDGRFAFGDGAAYDPKRDSWRKIADGPAHPGFQASWTGRTLLMFAKGRFFGFDPATNSWSPRNDADQFPADGRLLWTGRELLFVGSTYGGNGPTGIVAAYTP